MITKLHHHRCGWHSRYRNRCLCLNCSLSGTDLQGFVRFFLRQKKIVRVSHFCLGMNDLRIVELKHWFYAKKTTPMSDLPITGIELPGQIIRILMCSYSFCKRLTYKTSLFWYFPWSLRVYGAPGRRAEAFPPIFWLRGAELWQKKLLGDFFSVYGTDVNMQCPHRNQ